MNEKVLIVAIGIVAILFVLSLIAVATYAPEQLNPFSPSYISGRTGGIVEGSQEFCAEYPESACNKQTYIPEDGQQAIKCYWNDNTANCEAGTGYI